MIEGRGQQWPGGKWLRETPKGDIDVIYSGDCFIQGFRYMRCPEFPPPPPAFAAPPKPELVLVRWKSKHKGEPFYVTETARLGRRFFCKVAAGDEFSEDEVEVIDETTGKPINEAGTPAGE